MSADPIFSKEELERYSRHLILPEFNIEGQRKLKSARVLVVGAGGLGIPVLQYLTAAGVGRIGIVDDDVVDPSNLQRQVIYTVDEVGQSKAHLAARKLHRLNPNVNFRVHEDRLTSANALNILKDYDLIVDGTDNFPTRYLVNDACALQNKPFIYGAIFRFEGQVAVFNWNGGPDYRDLFPTPPPPGMVPNCAEGGVLGVLPGIIGSMQAAEALKVLTGVGSPLCGKLFVMDTASFDTRLLTVTRNPDRPEIKKLMDYEMFCSVGESTDKDETIPHISVGRLRDMMASEEDFQLVDVREPYEYDIVNLGGLLIPQAQIPERHTELIQHVPVVVHCRTGKRSERAVATLLDLGHTNVLNLQGGMMAWIDEIDPTLPRY